MIEYKSSIPKSGPESLCDCAYVFNPVISGFFFVFFFIGLRS